MNSNVIFETERLILRATTNEDIDVLHDIIFSDQDVMRYIFKQRPMSRNEVNELINKEFTFDKEKIGRAPLIEKDTGKVIGIGGYNPCNYLGVDDINVSGIFGKDSWTKGYAIEVGNAHVNFALNTLNYDRLLITCVTENKGVMKVLDKMGCGIPMKVSLGASGLERYVYLIHKWGVVWENTP